jgi:NADP-dependent 3-hydroxy acid dehydrogenase YdfG
MNSLKDKTFLVTGASSGIGRALSEKLLQQGARVLGVSRQPSSLLPEISPIEADLTSPDDIARMFEGIGSIDGLINSAGIAYSSKISDGDPAEWEEMWQLNVHGLALCCQKALEHFPDSGGRIVNVSSMSGHRVPPSGGFYSPTKFAVKAVTDALRLEMKAANRPIRVSSVSPGYVETPLLKTYFKGREDELSETKSEMKMLQPEDVADCIISILTTPAYVEIGDISLRSVDQGS